jgi:hypothetical protein
LRVAPRRGQLRDFENPRDGLAFDRLRKESPAAVATPQQQLEVSAFSRRFRGRIALAQGSH